MTDVLPAGESIKPMTEEVITSVEDDTEKYSLDGNGKENDVANDNEKDNANDNEKENDDVNEKDKNSDNEKDKDNDGTNDNKKDKENDNEAPDNDSDDDDDGNEVNNDDILGSLPNSTENTDFLKQSLYDYISTLNSNLEDVARDDEVPADDHDHDPDHDELLFSRRFSIDESARLYNELTRFSERGGNLPGVEDLRKELEQAESFDQLDPSISAKFKSLERNLEQELKADQELKIADELDPSISAKFKSLEQELDSTDLSTRKFTTTSTTEPSSLSTKRPSWNSMVANSTKSILGSSRRLWDSVMTLDNNLNDSLSELQEELDGAVTSAEFKKEMEEADAAAAANKDLLGGRQLSEVEASEDAEESEPKQRKAPKLKGPFQPPQVVAQDDDDDDDDDNQSQHSKASSKRSKNMRKMSSKAKKVEEEFRWFGSRFIAWIFQESYNFFGRFFSNQLMIKAASERTERRKRWVWGRRANKSDTTVASSTN